MTSSRFVMLQQLDPANCLTLVGLGFSAASACFSIQGQIYPALIGLLAAGVVDLLDGFVARKIDRTQLQAALGQQLDTIVDVCSFGFNPAIFAYCFGLQDPISIAILLLYLGATALRLAYFNCSGLTQEGSQQYFTGLPVTYAALFIPLVALASLVTSSSAMNIVFDWLYLGLAIAMISSFKIKKLQGVWYGIFCSGALLLAGVYITAIITP